MADKTMEELDAEYATLLAEQEQLDAERKAREAAAPGEGASMAEVAASEPETPPAEVVHFKKKPKTKAARAPKGTTAKQRRDAKQAAEKEEREARREARKETRRSKYKKLSPAERSKRARIGGLARIAKLNEQERVALARKGHEASCGIKPSEPVPCEPVPCEPVPCLDGGGYRGSVCGELITPQGKERACYSIVPINSLITSHNPETWRPDPMYPAMVQERDYTGDKEEQAKVGRIANNPDPALLLANAPTPADGPPVVTGSGVVLGGNGRTMGLKLAYAMNTAAPYVKELIERAPMFGLSAEAVEGVDRPVLVRVVQGLDAASQADLADASSRMNESLTGSLDEKAKGVSDSRRLSPDTLTTLAAAIERHETLRRAMAEEGREIVRALRSDGIITPQSSAAMVNSMGGLTEAGKARVEGAFLGLVAGTPDRLEQASAATIQRLERLVPYLAAVKAINPAADAIPTFQAAMDLLHSAEKAGMTIDEFLSQGSLFEAAPAPEPTEAQEEVSAEPTESPWRDQAPTVAEARETFSEQGAPEVVVEDVTPPGYGADVIPITREPEEFPFDPEHYSKLVADSPEQIRKVDVERLMEECPTAHRPTLAKWLRSERPDLKGEVDRIMAQIGAADDFFDARATYHITGLPGGDEKFTRLTKQEFIDKVEALGDYKHSGQLHAEGVRPELYGQPTFQGLNGPSWGGDGPAYEVNATWAEENASGVPHGSTRPPSLDREEAIKRIRQGLKQRSKKEWSVRGKTGASYGYFTISSPPKRLGPDGLMTSEERAELSKLLGGVGVHPQGKTVSPDPGFYEEFVDRAWGRTPARLGVHIDHD